MKKEIYVFVEDFEKDKPIITTAIESGVDGILVKDKDLKNKIEKLARIKVYLLKDEKNKDLENFVYILIKNKKDEEKATELAKKGYKVLVETTDWTIIPLENILAQTDNIYTFAKNEKEAQTALEILEKGVKGVVLKTKDINFIRSFVSKIKADTEKLNFVEAEIEDVIPLGMCDRVCVDTCSLLKPGEGMLVGNSSSGMFLVHAETEENPYVASRPFRVNAGAVHMYIRLPNNKTKYLCELQAGDEVMVYNYKGEGRKVYVGRNKLERRPMLLIKAKVKLENGKEKEISAVLQNAETIRLTKPDGKPISVVNLKKGDKVIAYVEEAGRHFGMKVKESIIEK